MAAYWDYNPTSTTSGNYYNPRTIWRSYTDGGTTSTTGYDWSNQTGTASTWGSPNTLYYYYTATVRVEKVLVRVPEHWGEPEIAGFTRLINDETKTGWTVEMVISGDIKITDPTVQIRDMAAFALLLKRYANQSDRETIDRFFATVPIEKPAE